VLSSIGEPLASGHQEIEENTQHMKLFLPAGVPPPPLRRWFGSFWLAGRRLARSGRHEKYLFRQGRIPGGKVRRVPGPSCPPFQNFPPNKRNPQVRTSHLPVPSPNLRKRHNTSNVSSCFSCGVSFQAFTKVFSDCRRPRSLESTSLSRANAASCFPILLIRTLPSHDAGKLKIHATLK